jgi:CspA family cold shock protein
MRPNPSKIPAVSTWIAASENGLPNEEIEHMPQRVTGSVKWFNAVKGYGFLARDDGGEVFVHQSALNGNGTHALDEGQRVEFVVAESQKGLQAQEVVLLD